MGNRVLLAAIREWELNYAKEPADKLLGQVILAAPDVDAATFAALLPSVIRRARSATLYYCPNDAALLASQAIHVNKPVGLAPFFTDGLDTINAEQVDTTMIGHGYYAAARELLFDLRLMLSYSKRPDDRRPPLGEKKMVYGYPLWAFVPIAR
jgi:esterase/lipase superfamily enzyme